MKILVAGFGNLLREDDGFGVEVIRRLRDREDLASEVTLLEVGIGGVSLVQELLAGYDGLVLTDALESDGGKPGDVKTLELKVADLSMRRPEEIRDYLADVHFAEPGRALALAEGVGCLPEKCFMVGCVPVRCDLGEGLSPAVAGAIEPAVDEVVRVTRALSRGSKFEFRDTGALGMSDRAELEDSTS